MTQKQTVHDWSSGQLVITEVDGEMPEEATPPPIEPPNETTD